MLDKRRRAFGKAEGRVPAAVEKAERQVEDRPLASLPAAFGLSMLLGELLDRR